MRFRTSIDDVQTFFKIVQSVEKIQKKCIIKLTEEDIHIICNSETNEGGLQVWSKVKVDSLFSNYRIQSNSENTITLTLAPEALLVALRSAAAPSTSSTSGYELEEVVMKLAKKNDQAVLSFEIAGLSRAGRRMRVTHDVRIEVMKPAEVQKLEEPRVPEPDVHVLLPPLNKLRTIVERLRPMANVLAFRANNNKKLQLSIFTESVKVETDWNNCVNPRSVYRAAIVPHQEDRDPDQIYEVCISLKGFSKFLNSYVVSTTTIACLCHHYCIILYVYIGDVADAGGVLTFYIPAMISE
ncbi:checkpoint protein Hus1/Mec3 [Amanita rubescens]|nr:checkpoint protein Hus1/Mec3 [Amanita rubescens]